MPFAVITTTNARKDIQQAIDWENSRNSNLGERFLEQLHLKISTLSATPFIGSIRYENKLLFCACCIYGKDLYGSIKVLV
jgi:hypothetical protein